MVQAVSWEDGLFWQLLAAAAAAVVVLVGFVVLHRHCLALNSQSPF